jgi:hypothetical protein
MIDEKIARVKALIEERERIDEELSALFGLAPRRGRPPKDAREPQTHAKPDDKLNGPSPAPVSGGSQ